MPPSSLAPTAQMLEVPGARLYYEVRGRGPLVVLVGEAVGGRGGEPDDWRSHDRRVEPGRLYVLRR